MRAADRVPSLWSCERICLAAAVGRARWHLFPCGMQVRSPDAESRLRSADRFQVGEEHRCTSWKASIPRPNGANRYDKALVIGQKPADLAGYEFVLEQPAGGMGDPKTTFHSTSGEFDVVRLDRAMRIDRHPLMTTTEGPGAGFSIAGRGDQRMIAQLVRCRRFASLAEVGCGGDNDRFRRAGPDASASRSPQDLQTVSRGRSPPRRD